ncbi:MAG: hypothetical protein ABIK09_03225 [Pseudomonadota bacterium]
MRTVVVVALAFLVVGCVEARAGSQGEPGPEPDIVTLEVREISVRTPKPGVHIVVPKMKTKWEPAIRGVKFVQEILYGPLPPVQEPGVGK